MNLTLRLFGREVLRLNTDPASDDKDEWRGDIGTPHALGFTTAPETPLREPGRDLT